MLPSLHDSHLLAALSDEEKRAVFQRADWCAKVSRASHSQKLHLVQMACAALGCGQRTFYNYLTKWHDSEGSLVSLIKRSRVRQPAVLPPEFLQWWVQHRASIKRDTKGRAAHRQLEARWKRWTKDPFNADLAIPGYDTPPPVGPNGSLPAGWSYGNLQKHAESAYVREATLRGRKSASDLTPSIHTTRIGVMPGQFLEFDDVKADLKVLYPGQSMPVVPVGFGVCDRASDYVPLIWWMSRLQRVDGTHRHVGAHQFMWFVLSYLCRHGVRRDTGTTLIGEHGTAFFSEDFQRGLKLVLKDKIGFDASGKWGRPLNGLGAEDSVGNSRFKRQIESKWNRMHNEQAHLPGATGRKWELKPADQNSSDKEGGRLLKLLESPHLSPERRELLQLSHLTFPEFVRLNQQVMHGINHDPNHACEEWEACGYVSSEYRYAGTWLLPDQFERLPEGERRQVILAADAGIEGLVRARRLTRAEVWQQHTPATAMRRLAPHELALVVPPDMRRTVTVREDHLIYVQDREAFGTPDPFVYVNECRGQHGHQILLPRGAKYPAILNPHMPEWLIILHPDGSYLGACPLRVAVVPGNEETLRAAFAQHGAAVGHEFRAANEAAAQMAADRAFRHEVNKRVTDTARPLTDKEHAAAALSDQATAAMLTAAASAETEDAEEDGDAALARMLAVE